jgi:uncharacterized protein YkwD
MVREMRRRTLLLFALLVVLSLPAALAPARATATTRAAGEQRDSGFELGVLREVNRLRVARGLRALTISTSLQAAAGFQSRDMLDRGYFDHDQPGGASFGARLKRFYPVGGSTWLVGENLLWSTLGITPAAAVKLWVSSPPHRRNLFDPAWRETGIGAINADAATGAFAEANGPVVVVTMDFGSRTSSRTTSAAR